MKKKFFFVINFYLIFCDLIDSYYHKVNETLIIITDTIKSISNRIPYDYYYLNLCAPEEKKLVQDNLGEILQSSRKYETNYKINMFQNEYCKILCKKNFTSNVANRFKFFILKKYSINFFLDFLPAGYVKFSNLFSDKIKKEVYYKNGIPIGLRMDDEYIIYNHYRFYVFYHNTTDNEKTQIVGFEIEPFSIEQNDNTNCLNLNGEHLNSIELLEKPYQFLDKKNDINIYFTYDVIFKNSNLSFASRFDHYLQVNTKIHWASIIISSIMILLFTFITVIIFLRAIKKDIDIYNVRVSNDDIIDEYGWKNISNEVFRKPINSELLSAFFGTGIQVIIALLYTLFFGFIGFFKPESRGSLLTMLLMVFIFIGIISGYLSGRLYKIFKGRNWLKSALYTALLFPSFCFGLLLIINWLYRMEDSTILIEFHNILSLIILWIFCSFPLVLLGSFIGIKQKGLELPCKVNPVPALIEEKNWFFKIKYAIFFTGLPPFGAIFIEFLYIMSALWKREFSFIPQFIFLSVFVLIITSSEIGILFTHANLCKGDYNWWWKSFFVSGSPSIYVILYSIYYYFKLKIKRLSTTIIFFGMMSLIAFMIFLMCGAFGMGLTFFFIRKIYSMIKMD